MDFGEALLNDEAPWKSIGRRKKGALHIGRPESTLALFQQTQNFSERHGLEVWETVPTAAVVFDATVSTLQPFVEQPVSVEKVYDETGWPQSGRCEVAVAREAG